MRRVDSLAVPTRIFPSPSELAQYAAEQFVQLVSEREARGEGINVGFATGASPLSFYREIIKRHHAGDISFKKIRIFMLDEYRGLTADNPCSFEHFIEKNLLQHLRDFDRRLFHIPPGLFADARAEEMCAAYESAIRAAGGIDFQLLGVGRNGHIGFNEPETPFDSRTGVRRLQAVTRQDAAADFFGVENVPEEGVTMGIASIMDAKRIMLIATNEGKARTIRALLEGSCDPILPASVLHRHPNAEVLIDEAAASELSLSVNPWDHQDVFDWRPRIVERYLCRRSAESKKPLRQLGSEDMQPHTESILAQNAAHSVEELRDRVERQIAQRILSTSADEKRTVLVFSPHPDDAEIQVGGSIQRFVEAGWEVYVAVMTSGRIAVWDHCAGPIIDHLDVLADWLEVSREEAERLRPNLLREASRKRRTPGEKDSPAMARLKGLIRANESLSGLKMLGVDRSRVRFLNLPFYETDAIEKRPPGDADVQRVRQVLDEFAPDWVLAAGDLSDPHGTHRVCLQVICQALQALRPQMQPRLLLYRGAWAEWETHDMDVIVPLDEPQLDRAVEAMRKHSSQIPLAMFPGTDARPFDQRARERKLAAAGLFTQYGLKMYAAEGFVEHLP